MLMFDIRLPVIVLLLFTAGFVLVNVIKIQAAWWLIEVDIGYNVHVWHKATCDCIATAGFVLVDVIKKYKLLDDC